MSDAAACLQGNVRDVDEKTGSTAIICLCTFYNYWRDRNIKSKKMTKTKIKKGKNMCAPTFII